MEKRFPFPKNMHLCSKKEFDKLMNLGTKRTVYPLKAIFLIEPFLPIAHANQPTAEQPTAEQIIPTAQSHQEESAEPIQIAISVPKKLFKRAVKRNRIKRLIREAFRLTYPHYAPLFSNISLRILYVYIHHDVTTEPRMVECINDLFEQMLDLAKKRSLISDASANKDL